MSLGDQRQLARGLDIGKGIEVAHSRGHVAPYAVVAVDFLRQEGVAGGIFLAGCCGGLGAAGWTVGERGGRALDDAGGAGQRLEAVGGVAGGCCGHLVPWEMRAAVPWEMRATVPWEMDASWMYS